MKIIYPANTTLPSARANTIQILNTANQLAAQGNEVHLVARKGNATETEIVDFYGITAEPNLTLHLVPASLFLSGARGHESLLLKRTLQILTHFRREPKLIFTRDPLFASILLKMRRLFRFRLVYEAHTLYFITGKETYMPVAWNENKEKRIRKREEFVFRKSDGIIFITSSLKKFTEQYFPISQPNVVVHDGTSVPSKLPAKKNLEFLCYSGQFYWWKGMSTLIESFRWVQGGILRLYGGNYSTVKDDLAKMQKMIDDFGLKQKIEFCGFIPPGKLPAAISECSIGVLPLPDNIIGNHCNSPLKLFDYMANGLAVVASDLLTVREIVQHGKDGHLVPPGDPYRLAEGMNQLLTNQAYRETITRAAFQTVQSYSWQNRGKQLHDFLLTMMNTGS